jgi:integrase
VIAIELKEKENITIKTYYEAVYLPFLLKVKGERKCRDTKSFFKTWIIPNLGSVYLVAVDKTHWTQLLDVLIVAGRTQRTIEYVGGELLRMLKHAKSNKFEVRTNKEPGFRPPKNNRRRRVLTSKESINILNHLKQRDICAYNLTKFAFLTGCRLSEATNLMWNHIDRERMVLSFVDTKNGTTRRIPITAVMDKLLTKIKFTCNSEFVFVNTLGMPYTGTPQAFINTIKALNLNEGRETLDRVCFHTIRHTIATRLASILDIRSLMDFLGWKQVSMAARYTHANEQKIKQAAEILNIDEDTDDEG